jgi:hypothetical protein
MKRILVFFLLLATVGFYGCEKVEMLKSEKGVEKELEGTWNLIPIPRTNPAEEWSFQDNTVIRRQMIGGVMTPIDTGHYTVKTTLMKSYVKFEDFRLVLSELNGEWQIVELSSNVFIIATDHDGSTGIMERDFSRKD